ncbi:MAG: hypothetical protein ABR497_06745 [Kiritimatiellia bacterium]
MKFKWPAWAALGAGLLLAGGGAAAAQDTGIQQLCCVSAKLPRKTEPPTPPLTTRAKTDTAPPKAQPAPSAPTITQAELRSGRAATARLQAEIEETTQWIGESQTQLIEEREELRAARQKLAEKIALWNEPMSKPEEQLQQARLEPDRDNAPRQQQLMELRQAIARVQQLNMELNTRLSAQDARLQQLEQAWEKSRQLYAEMSRQAVQENARLKDRIVRMGHNLREISQRLQQREAELMELRHSVD